MGLVGQRLLYIYHDEIEGEGVRGPFSVYKGVVGVK
jgi:hypothetical protein